ncbi:hypothetical protein LVX13_02850 [Streptomyces albulus]|uniref:hypothetical protein n=1 Tax=Streptomyces noursei TaxID=1971 RepID=UPI001F4870F2|nr:hypothetical protein [Streptomyces noursei]MCE4942072.1 hypothetical protein [Streptomyces noursei]
MTSVKLAATQGAPTTTGPATWLRRFLALDAVVTGANGLAYLLAPGPVGRLIGVDPGLLAGLGAFLTAYGAAAGVLAVRARQPALTVRLVVLANVVWAVSSLVAPALWFDASTAGTVWIPLQGVVVGGFAALQYGAFRRCTA